MIVFHQKKAQKKDDVRFHTYSRHIVKVVGVASHSGQTAAIMLAEVLQRDCKRRLQCAR